MAVTQPNALKRGSISNALYKILKLGVSQGAFLPGPNPGTPGHNGVQAGHGAAYNGPRKCGPRSYSDFASTLCRRHLRHLGGTGRLSADAFASFNTDGSSVEMIGAEHSPGFELTTGSFGQAVRLCWRHRTSAQNKGRNRSLCCFHV